MIIEGSMKWDREIIKFETERCSYLVGTETNQVVMLTARGLEILTLDSSATNCQDYHRELIRPSNNNPLKKYLESNDNTVLWSSSFEDINAMARNPEATPCISKIPVTIQIIDFAFSPFYRNEQYLAILTSNGALDLYKNEGECWEACCDIVQLWLDKCTSDWITPRNYPEWKVQLNEGKPVNFCWFYDEGSLFMIVSLLSGDLVIFEDCPGLQFKLKVKTRITFALEETCILHALKAHGRVVILAGSCDGQITALTLDNWKVKGKEMPYKNKDFIIAERIISSGNHVLIHRSQDLLIITINALTFNTRKITFDHAISCVSSLDGLYYVTLENQCLIKLSPLPVCAEIERHQFQILSPSHAIVIGNGFLAVFVSENERETSLSVVTSSVLEPRSVLKDRLSKGWPMMKCLDLLWLHKLSLLNDLGMLNEAGKDSMFPQLCYWELVLRCTTAKSESTIAEVRQMMTPLETALVKSAKLPSMSSKNPLKSSLSCSLCGSELSENTILYTKCVNGHSLPRCCRSLKSCLTPYVKACVLCPAVITNEEYDSTSDFNCYFCGGRFISKFPLLKKS